MQTAYFAHFFNTKIFYNGEHNYQDDLDDAKGNAQDSVNNNGNITPGEGNLIGDYFDGISN